VSGLIEELKKEHEEISAMLQRVKEYGIGSKEGRHALLLAKEGLLAHLKKEDEELYPVLMKEADIDESFKRTLDIFAKDMAEISDFALEFFNTYSKGELGPDFAENVGFLFAKLSQRISKEEIVIYAKYDELVKRR